MFALVDETPGKGENSVSTHGPLNTTPNQLDTLVSDLSSKPPAPVTPISSASSKTSPTHKSQETAAQTPVSKFWNHDDSSTSNEEDSTDDELEQIRDTLKRKEVDSPANKMLAAFEKVIFKKQKKKLRKSLTQQKS